MADVNEPPGAPQKGEKSPSKPHPQTDARAYHGPNGQTAPENDEIANIARSRATKLLARSDKGMPYNTVSNLLVILRHDPTLAELINLNLFSNEPSILRPPPQPDHMASPMAGPYPRLWTDADESLILAYIQRTWSHQAKEGTLHSAMVAEATMRGFHPIRDYLDGLKWDGTPRIDTWMCKAFGSEDTPYIHDIAAKFLIAAVRRVRQPGCKFDFMLVLEGEQGIGKSTALATLFTPRWFSDSLAHDLSHKDAAIGLLGVWCVELPEIDQLIRTEVETIKAFLARSSDKYRPPFGRVDVSLPRQGVIVGTTNRDDYLRDETGNRRFWPARCTCADVAWIAENRDQLWAEASLREAAGEAIWLHDTEVQATAAEHQADRMVQDPWHDKIASFLENHVDDGYSETTNSQIMSDALFIPIKDHTKAQQMRVGIILRLLRWKKVVVKEKLPTTSGSVSQPSQNNEDGRSIKAWRRPDR